MPVLLLILESFGTSELLLILVVALIFFGPRKLPQLSRQIGKSLAEFKKASEDFKRTWEREVALETARAEPEPTPSILPRENSLLDTTVGRSQAYSVPENEFAAQQESPADLPATPDETASVSSPAEPAHSEPAPKRDWL